MNQKEKVERFRAKFREEKPKWFSATLHYLFNGVTLISLSIYLFFQITDLRAIELIVIPVMMLLGNLSVYLIHRYPLHKKYKYIKKETYQQHTLWHHRFYTNANYQVEKKADIHALFFPPKVIIFFTFLFIPGMFFLLELFLTNNLVFLTLSMSSIYFILYEIVHFTSHLPEKHWLLKIGHLKAMRQHHLIHHNPRFMNQCNFNIVFPLSDYIFRTKKVNLEP
jgi:hypothetical protein